MASGNQTITLGLARGSYRPDKPEKPAAAAPEKPAAVVQAAKFTVLSKIDEDLHFSEVNQVNQLFLWAIFQFANSLMTSIP